MYESNYHSRKDGPVMMGAGVRKYCIIGPGDSAGEWDLHITAGGMSHEFACLRFYRPQAIDEMIRALQTIKTNMEAERNGER